MLFAAEECLDRKAIGSTLKGARQEDVIGGSKNPGAAVRDSPQETHL